MLLAFEAQKNKLHVFIYLFHFFEVIMPQLKHIKLKTWKDFFESLLVTWGTFFFFKFTSFYLIEGICDRFVTGQQN